MKPIFEPVFMVPEAAAAGEAALVFNNRWAFLATPSSLWRIDLAMPSGTRPDQLVVEKGAIQWLHVAGDDLYLLKAAGGDSGHVLLRSSDDGQSFQPLDAALEVDEAGYRTKLMPTRLVRSDRGLFINAGGGRNLFFSNDDGRTWITLHGTRSTQVCYGGKILVLGDVVLLGGECPLDIAYVLRGTLTLDQTEWASEPVSVKPSDLSNRNVQFFAHVSQWDSVVAGVEGGLLISTNGGLTWQWSIKHCSGSGSYPYIKDFALWPSQPDTAFIGGFDKATTTAYLGLTIDHGVTWRDVSASIAGFTKTADASLATVTHPDGSVVVAVFDGVSASIIVARLLSI